MVLSHLGDHNGVGSPRTPKYFHDDLPTPAKIGMSLLRPNDNSPFASNSAKRSVSSDNVSTPYSVISGISSYDYEDDFTSEDDASEFSAMTNLSRRTDRTDKSSRIPIKRSSSLRRRPDLLKGGSGVDRSPTLPSTPNPAPVPEPQPEVEDLLLLTNLLPFLTYLFGL